MITLRCVVERITYQNPENGYTVLRAAVRNYKELVTVVGNLLDVNVGSVLLLQGDWKVDPKYGNQFCAEKWEETMPATVYGIEKYLGSGLIRGVGPKFAGRIVRTFGTDTLTVIEEETDRLLLVPGIGEKRVQMIRDSWEKQKEIKNIMLFLQSHNVSTSFAAKIYKVYGNESIQVVRENPYRLADDIWGVGFKTADGLAEKLGFAKDDPLRCRSGILYTLNALADEGACVRRAGAAAPKGRGTAGSEKRIHLRRPGSDAGHRGSEAGRRGHLSAALLLRRDRRGGKAEKAGG